MPKPAEPLPAQYPLALVAKALSRPARKTRRQFARVGWAFPFTPSPWSRWYVPERVMSLHLPEIKKIVDSWITLEIKTTQRGKYPRTDEYKRDLSAKMKSLRSRGTGKP